MQIITRSLPVTIPIGVIGRRQKQPRIQSCTLPMKPVDEVPAEHELQRELEGALAAPLVSSRALNPLHVALLRSNKTGAAGGDAAEPRALPRGGDLAAQDGA
jgi:hypothetical protein